jgi:uncharacterized protein (TIGR00251 family)
MTLILNLYIQPNASRTEVGGLHGDALKIKISAPPTDHQANDLLLEFLAESFKVGRKQVILKHGEHARQKTVIVYNPRSSPEALLDTA